MRIRRRTIRRLFPLSLLLLLFATPALSQNLLVNPGFDRDVAGWTPRSYSYPDPTHGDASATWTATDATGRAASGGLALHATTGYHQIAQLSLDQCFDTSEGRLISFGAKFLTTRQFGESSASVDVAFFGSPACGGSQLGSAQATSSGLVGYPEMSSQGIWLPASAAVLSSPDSRSMRVSVTASSVGVGYYGSGYVDAIADDVYVMTAPAALTSWILPSAAWVHGAGGIWWSTQIWLSNPGAADATVKLKWLGHDADGRGGPEFTYVVRAGEIVAPNVWSSMWFPEDYGAIRISSSSASLVVQSETSTSSRGGTVGQALPAFGPADYAGATPKTLAPIRENTSFRTNLVLANSTEIPITAHVALFAADGTAIGTRDVDLPPLGMTQINRVTSALGAASLDAGRIAVSTPTPGGLVAAYASVIDNTTNDPRTLLPR